MVRVQPGARRQGIGKALLAAATEVARAEGSAGLMGRVVDPDDDAARGMGGEVRIPGDAAGRRAPASPAPGRRRGRGGRRARCALSICAAPMRSRSNASRTCRPRRPWLPIPFERWHERIAGHAATFVALDGGRVVGRATLGHLHGQPHRLEHGLTAVLRSHRGRGRGDEAEECADRLGRRQRLHGADHGHRHDESSRCGG